MDLRAPLARTRELLLRPRATWPLIAAESTTATRIYTRHVLLLAAVPALCSGLRLVAIGDTLPFAGTLRPGALAALRSAADSYVLILAGVLALARVVSAVAPLFGGRREPLQALRLVAYAGTATWISGAGYLLPLVGWPVRLAGGAYSIYLLYLGLPVTMHCPRGQATACTLVIVLAAIVVGTVISALLSALAR